MKSRDFVYWLQGYFELLGTNEQIDKVSLDARQTAAIRRHLALVFKHEIDPGAGDAKVQEALNHLHSGKDRPQGVDLRPTGDDILIRC